jgi:hypothetical protein
VEQEVSMHEYEIRILQAGDSPSLITAEIHLSDTAAIRSARKMARGRPFEVWRGVECISGRARLSEPPAKHPPDTATDIESAQCALE